MGDYCNREKLFSLSEELNLKMSRQLLQLVDNLGISETRNLIVQVICGEKKEFEDMLSDITGLSLSVHPENVLTANVEVEKKGIVISTEYGAIGIDGENLKAFLSQKHPYTEFRVCGQDLLPNNVELKITLENDYHALTDDEWRVRLLKADYLIMAVDAYHVLSISQRDFIENMVKPIFSSSRMAFGIYNADQIRSGEYEELEELFSAKLGSDYLIFPIFSEGTSNKLKSKYKNNDKSVKSLLKHLHTHAIDVRSQHVVEVDDFLRSSFLSELERLKDELESTLCKDNSKFESFSLDKQSAEESRRHIVADISLFLESSPKSYFRKTTSGFANEFKRSLSEDIELSADIKRDAKFLPRYISYVWDRFIADQNKVVSAAIEKELRALFEMIKLDVGHLVTSIPSEKIRDKITKKLICRGGVNSFFSRRTTSGNGLTDTLTIGGLVLGIFVTPVAFLAVITSEFIKVFGKKAIDSEYKKELVTKVSETIDKNTELILTQGDKRIAEVIAVFEKEMKAFYDSIIDEIERVIAEEKAKIKGAQTTLKKINNILQAENN